MSIPHSSSSSLNEPVIIDLFVEIEEISSPNSVSSVSFLAGTERTVWNQTESPLEYLRSANVSSSAQSEYMTPPETWKCSFSTLLPVAGSNAT